MANQKITDLPQAVNSMQATDLMEVSIDNGGGIFTSESFTGQQVSDGVIGVISNYAIIGCAYSAQTQTFSALTATAVVTETLDKAEIVNFPEPALILVLKLIKPDCFL